MKNLLKILMLEDVEEDAGLIERSLKKSDISFVSKRVDTREEFVEALEQFLPDVILSDHSLPQFNSIKALSLCREKYPNMPFILVTGTVSEEFAVSCLKQGADDYVLKGNLTRLASAINNALKQRYAEQERKTAEETLKSQNEELIKVNMELDKFVYSTSHDLRAPLKSVLGLVKISQKDLSKGEHHHLGTYLNMMATSIYKLDYTLRDILHYSRNKRQDIQKEIVDIEKLIQDTMEDMSYMGQSQKIQKNIKIDAKVPLCSDISRLKVVVSNLLSNSIRYSKEGSESFININIVTYSHKAVITISDNGIGIDDEYKDKVFDMFFRATEKSDGSGLGLYIVKETVNKLGGTIDLISEKGVGSTFVLEIPNYAKESILPKK